MSPLIPMDDNEHARLMTVRERQKSLMLRAWIFSGLFFMALPGTLLGFSNLMAISAHHGAAGMPPAWMEGHGHAQMFGWIGSFILGIGFYSQPVRGRSAIRIPLSCFLLWTTGVLLRWIANIYAWHWTSLFIISSATELIAVALFLYAASHHKRSESPQSGSKRAPMPVWMTSVMLGTLGMAIGVTFNFVECVRLAMAGTSPSFPHALDQKYLLILGWGFIVPMVWGFSARWLPAFLSLKQPHAKLFSTALAIDVFGIIFGSFGVFVVGTVLLVIASIVAIFALNLFLRTQKPAKTIGVHPSYSIFIRIVYVWLVIAAALSIWASIADVHGGIWGASRHALTVGFAATMVFAIGPRILPHFCGIVRIFSTRLMFVSLLLLQIGCTLRVSSEPLAYEGFSSFAWKVLPVSGMFELTAVLVFALNMVLTLALGRSIQSLADNLRAA